MRIDDLIERREQDDMSRRNCEWVRAKVAEKGWTEEIQGRAAILVASAITVTYATRGVVADA